jgi:hypothetical protein
MISTSKFAFASLAGGAIGFVTACVLDFTPPPLECWCGEQWSAQISGATAFDDQGFQVEIQTSATTHTRCVSMLEHLALDAADPQNPVYMALRDAFESEAISNCELAGAALLPGILDHTDCATSGIDPVTTNLVYLGPCWVAGDLEAEPICPDEQCNRFYDCSDEVVYLWDGRVEDEGETEGWVPWTGEEDLWSCEEPARIDGPDAVRY